MSVRVGSQSGKKLYLVQAVAGDAIDVQNALDEEEQDNDHSDSARRHRSREDEQGRYVYGMVCEGRLRTLLSFCGIDE